LYEVYRGRQPGPVEQGELFDFEEVKLLVALKLMAPRTIVRVIGPSDATAEEIDHLRQIGAFPTFP